MPNQASYLGIDLASHKPSVYAVTRDGQEFETGTVALENLPELLAQIRPEAVAAEHTGALAEKWMRVVEGAGYEFYLIHSTERKGLNRVAHQAHKDDKRDAITIARMIRMWHNPETRRLVAIHKDIFLRMADVAKAWELRGLLRAMNAQTRNRTEAKQRLAAATATERKYLAQCWEQQAKSKIPEEAEQGAMAFAKEYFAHELELLLSMPGIGNRTALWLIATLCPIERFVEYGPGFRLRSKDSAQVGKDLTFGNVKRYLGLNPRVHQSGESAKAEFIQRLGAKPVRANLYVSAMKTLQLEGLPQTVTFYEAKEKREAKPKGQRGQSQGRKLVVRIALRQLRVAVAILRSGQPYRGPGERVAPEKWQPPAHLISQAEAARLLGVSRQWVGQLVSNGDLQTEQVQRPCPKPGGAAKGTRMVLRSSIEARLEVSPCTK